MQVVNENIVSLKSSGSEGAVIRSAVEQCTAEQSTIEQSTVEQHAVCDSTRLNLVANLLHHTRFHLTDGLSSDAIFLADFLQRQWFVRQQAFV